MKTKLNKATLFKTCLLIFLRYLFNIFSEIKTNIIEKEDFKESIADSFQRYKTQQETLLCRRKHYSEKEKVLLKM